MSVTGAALFAALAIVGPVAHSVNETTANNKLIDHLDEYAAQDEPGVQYVVVDKTSTLFSHAVGLSDVSQAAPLTSAHTMAAFSMTKTLTAVAVLQLFERGLIDLDNRVSRYVAHPYDGDVTIQQLLSHTSGIPNPIPLRWAHLSQDHDRFDEAVELKQILRTHAKPDSRPGSAYRYSNIGYWLLGAVIAAASGQPYTEYVSKHIFQPLNLSPDEMGFVVREEDNHANGYLQKWSLMGLIGRFFVDAEIVGENENGWIRIKDVYLNGPSFGGAIGSAMAFSRILQDLLSDESRLLKSSTKRLLYERQSTHDGKVIEMTLAWHTGELDGTRYFYKEGGGAGFRSEMRIYPEAGLGSVIMANRTTLNTTKILGSLDRNFLTE